MHVTLAEFLTNMAVSAEVKFSQSLNAVIELYHAFHEGNES